ncbi:MAG: DUF1624 domain-containing protein [Acidaminococcaceae bacterium]|nr:DUF1624 domain-containing protein [Acidaminococcaceae bacterium]
MRYRLIDTLRGFSLVSMMLFHACWDLVYLYGADWPWYKQTPGYLWQQSICWVFILLSGFCMGLKQDKAGVTSYKRGLTVLFAGILVTVATLLFMPESPIIFGVLFFLGTAMLLTAALLPLLQKVSGETGLLAGSVSFFLLRNINQGNLGFESFILYELPGKLYDLGLPATFLGFQDKNFVSADYFSLLPWYFLFLAGYFLCRCLLQKKATQEDAAATETGKLSVLPGWFQAGISPLEFLGKHSLLVYLLHQPVILLALSLVLKR